MTAVETRRFDAKLDSFLRRRLPQEDYDRISTSEPCVVLSPEDKRVHRFAVLGHQCLYLTEVPPKNLKVALRLKDACSIRVVSPTWAVRSSGDTEGSVSDHDKFTPWMWSACMRTTVAAVYCTLCCQFSFHDANSGESRRWRCSFWIAALKPSRCSAWISVENHGLIPHSHRQINRNWSELEIDSNTKHLFSFSQYHPTVT